MAEIPPGTALDLPVEEWHRYDPAGSIRQQQRALHTTLQLRRKSALTLAYKAARLLWESYGAQRMVLFGSLVIRNAFTQWSDIDLAAWGIPTEQFYTAVAAVTGLSAEFKIDLVDPESCKSSIRVAILQANCHFSRWESAKGGKLASRAIITKRGSYV